ncbi:MAG: hypothetical protein ACR2OV_11630 [Hyphomicrobiaceae bacterium]
MTNSPASLLEGLDIVHEPREILGLVLIAASDAMARHGVRMTFGTFNELIAVNAANQDSWFPLHTAFRSDVGGANDENGIVIFGRNRMGRIVTAHAVRLFDWNGTDLKQEAQSLRLFYADPRSARDAGEYCTIHAEAASCVTGRCAYIGGLWCDPGYRGRGRVRLITAVTRATALAQWGFENLVGLMSADNMAKDFHRRTGMVNVLSPGGTLTNSPTHPGGDIHFAIAYLSAMQLVDELVKLLLDLRSEVDGMVEQRRA